MEVLNACRIVLKALQRNKIRSALSTLVVIIGVASVIAMTALSSGARAAIHAQIQSTGTNVVYVSAGRLGRLGPVPGRIRSLHTRTRRNAPPTQQPVQAQRERPPLALSPGPGPPRHHPRLPL